MVVLDWETHNELSNRERVQAVTGVHVNILKRMKDHRTQSISIFSWEAQIGWVQYDESKWLCDSYSRSKPRHFQVLEICNSSSEAGSEFMLHGSDKCYFATSYTNKLCEYLTHYYWLEDSLLVWVGRSAEVVDQWVNSVSFQEEYWNIVGSPTSFWVSHHFWSL
jgi:hypothetical protein